MVRTKRPGERDESMITKKFKLVLRISFKVKRLFLDLAFSPYQAEIIEMILTTVDFLEAIISELW